MVQCLVENVLILITYILCDLNRCNSIWSPMNTAGHYLQVPCLLFSLPLTGTRYNTSALVLEQEICNWSLYISCDPEIDGWISACKFIDRRCSDHITLTNYTLELSLIVPSWIKWLIDNNFNPAVFTLSNKSIYINRPF